LVHYAIRYTRFAAGPCRCGAVEANARWADPGDVRRLARRAASLCDTEKSFWSGHRVFRTSAVFAGSVHRLFAVRDRQRQGRTRHPSSCRGTIELAARRGRRRVEDRLRPTPASDVPHRRPSDPRAGFSMAVQVDDPQAPTIATGECLYGDKVRCFFRSDWRSICCSFSVTTSASFFVRAAAWRQRRCTGTRSARCRP